MDAKPLHRITAVLQIAVHICLVLSLLGVGAATLGAFAHFFPPEIQLIAGTNFLFADIIMAIFDFVQRGFYFLFFLLFLVWSYQLCKNLRIAAENSVRYSLFSTIVWHFVPIINLYKPGQIIHRFWAVAHKQEVRRHNRVILWWTLWVFAVYSMAFASAAAERAETHANYIVVYVFYAVSYGLSLAFFLATGSLLERFLFAYTQRLDEYNQMMHERFEVDPQPSTLEHAKTQQHLRATYLKPALASIAATAVLPLCSLMFLSTNDFSLDDYLAQESSHNIALRYEIQEQEQRINPFATLPHARKGFTSRLKTSPHQERPPITPPPASIASLVHYNTDVGKLPAYITHPPTDAQQPSPAIIWIAGGNTNIIGSELFHSDDQSVRSFRDRGIITMFPSLRGGNLENPGQRESFLGEVDDILAAHQYLAAQPSVDPDRIYLGGHSTGGTLALLVAASSHKFRAVFSFGPAHDVSQYSDDLIAYNRSNPQETYLRSPGNWMQNIKTPTLVIEGTEGNSNYLSLQVLEYTSDNENVSFLPIQNADHFNVLGPATSILATQIAQDTQTNFQIPANAFENLFETYAP